VLLTLIIGKRIRQIEYQVYTFLASSLVLFAAPLISGSEQIKIIIITTPIGGAGYAGVGFCSGGEAAEREREHTAVASALFFLHHLPSIYFSSFCEDWNVFEIVRAVLTLPQPSSQPATPLKKLPFLHLSLSIYILCVHDFLYFYL